MIPERLPYGGTSQVFPNRQIWAKLKPIKALKICPICDKHLTIGRQIGNLSELDRAEIPVLNVRNNADKPIEL